MAMDVNTLIRKAKTLSNGVAGAVNVGQGLRTVPAEKHYSRGQMLNFAQLCTGIADAVMGLPDNGRGDRADANRLFASAGGKFYELANDITGTAHQFSFQIANAPDKLIVTGIKVLERMATGKSAKAPRELMGITFDEGDSRMIHYCKRQIGRFLNKFPDPSPMDVTQYVTRFLYGNLPPVIRERLKDLMRTAETAPTGELRRFYVMRLLQLLNSGRPHQVIQRLKQPYAPGPGKSAKATVVKSAKAHGVARTKAEGGELRSRAAGFIVRMRASMERGYINIDEAKGLMQLLRSSADLENEDRKLVWAMQRSRDIYGTVMANRVRGMGNQMVNVDSEQRRLIGAWLQQIATFISGRTHGYLRKEPLIRRVRG